VAETCAWAKEKNRRILTKHKEKRSYPLGKACGELISSGSNSSFTSALEAGEKKRGGTGWMGIGSGVSGSRISPS